MRKLPAILLVLAGLAERAHADDDLLPPMDVEVSGFAMLDVGFDFGQVGDPAWFDTVRPTKLPSFEDEFGKGGRYFAGVRQSRFGIKATSHTDYGDVDGKFEFEMFGTGVDEGQTTFRLRHFYVDWLSLRAGQTWSPFMDIDVFPNSVEYWGPNGMAFFRNVQLAWMPIRGDSRVTVALERPGASPDTGIYAERVELDDVVPAFPLPDLSAEARWGDPDWGHLEIAGILRYIGWDDIGAGDLEGHAWGWGLNLSSNLKVGPGVFKLSAIYGSAIQNYMNDAGSDIGLDFKDGDPTRPEGKGIPCLGLVGFFDMNWSEMFTSTIGYSYVRVWNTDGQTPDAFEAGHYALANVMVLPTKGLMLGPELQFGRRENADDFDSNDFRLQFSVKGSFSAKAKM